MWNQGHCGDTVYNVDERRMSGRIRIHTLSYFLTFLAVIHFVQRGPGDPHALLTSRVIGERPVVG